MNKYNVMNDAVVELIQAHRSIRRFTTQPIHAEDFAQIIRCAQSASTSSFQQCVSIIRVSDQAYREQLEVLTGNQPYVAQAAEFMVFCADFNRHHCMLPDSKLGYIEQLVTASIDAGLMAQNALLATQSLGLGGVYIGGIRNHPKEVVALLKLPEQVFPLFGLCLGYPAQAPQQKPRLPESVVLHENYYHPMDPGELERYNQIICDYYAQRSSNTKHIDWTHLMREKLSGEARPFMMDCCRLRGLRSVRCASSAPRGIMVFIHDGLNQWLYRACHKLRPIPGVTGTVVVECQNVSG